MINTFFAHFEKVSFIFCFHQYIEEMIKYVILLSKQGKIRLIKWYLSFNINEKQQIIREITTQIPLRKGKMCNFIESSSNTKTIYKRYASLYFIIGIDNEENELIILDTIQKYVEIMDKAYGNVCELDIVFNFELAYQVLNELIVAGHVIETSMVEILNRIRTANEIENAEDLNGKLVT